MRGPFLDGVREEGEVEVTFDSEKEKEEAREENTGWLVVSVVHRPHRHRLQPQSCRV